MALKKFSFNVTKKNGYARLGKIITHRGVIDTPAFMPVGTQGTIKGAFLNDRRLRVAKRNKLSDSVVVTGIPHIGRGNKEQFIEEIDQIISEVAGIRRSGSAALDLAWVAAGRYDGYFQHGLNLWDIAAGIILVKEAGGITNKINLSNTENINVIASSENISVKLNEKLINF